MPVPPPVADSLTSPAAAADRLALLAVALRDKQLGGDCGAAFGGIALAGSALCAAGAPSFELTCGAVWAWGAATRASAYRHAAAAEVELCSVARDAAWLFLTAAEANRRTAGAPLCATEAAALLLAAASELLLGDDEQEPLARRAVVDLTGALRLALRTVKTH